MCVAKSASRKNSGAPFITRTIDDLTVKLVNREGRTAKRRERCLNRVPRPRWATRRCWQRQSDDRHEHAGHGDARWRPGAKNRNTWPIPRRSESRYGRRLERQTFFRRPARTGPTELFSNHKMKILNASGTLRG